MQLTIAHRTSYRFSRPVFLEPHTLRLMPRGDGAQRLNAFSVTITPEPQTLTACLDAWGNRVHRLWFLDTTDQLDIQVTSEVTTLRENPFDFLGERLGALHGTPEWQALQPALERAFAYGAQGDIVAPLAARFRDAADGDPMGFCTALCQHLHTEIEKVERLEPGILPPHELLGSGRGSCRDVAVCFIECCRSRGLPARFVSGYQHPAMEGDSHAAHAEVEHADRELHAWAEVYLPGGGWRGFDPTHGLVVADRHVPVAAAPHWNDAMPLSGHFRGTGVSRMTHHVLVKEA